MKLHAVFTLLVLATCFAQVASAATFIVTNAADAGPGTLRQAIANANATPGADVVEWNAPEGGSIFLQSALPEITDTLTIDGTTQPGYVGQPIITVYVPVGIDGLVIAATNCVVRGMAMFDCGNAVVLRDTARGTILGGSNGAGNRFAYSTEAAVRIEGGSGHVILGNTLSDNIGVGISIAGGSNCVVQYNEIRGNGGAGVRITAGTNNSIRINSIFNNTGLGIDLRDDDVTSNDTDDADTGPNRLQNFPIITSAAYSGSTLVVSGTMNSRPNTALTLDFYSNLVGDDSGYGEGQLYLGSTNITTANNGDRNFTVTLTNALAGWFITATATDAAGSTSEFSPSVRFSSSLAPILITVTNANDAGPGSLRQAILDSNTRFANAPNTISFNIPGPGVHRILLVSDLPQIVQSTTIDGYTQPGSGVNTATNSFNGSLTIQLDGIQLSGRALDFNASGGNTVRGLNIINFAGAAVAFSRSGNNVISGNLIGVTINGPLGQGWVFEPAILFSSCSNSLVGGTNIAARNVVAGSAYGDLALSGSASNKVLGNFFGSDVTGTNGVWVGGFGIWAYAPGAFGNIIGGTNDAARNVFLGHNGSDIRLGEGALGTVIQGNYVAVGSDGNLLPGQFGGIILSGCSNTLVGGTNNGAGNLIAGSIGVTDGTGNALLRNSILILDIVGNPGIDLGGDGPTPNDPDDADSGANDFQNHPEILSAVRYPNRTLIRSQLQGISNATYRIDFYSSDRLPPNFYPEARTWLGTTNVTIGVSGLTNFNWSAPTSVVAGLWITATATDKTNNTSELAPAMIVASSNAVNLVVSLSYPADSVSRTSNFTYTVQVRNLGPTNATGVVLSNLLPANVSFVSAATTQGSCTHTAGQVNCSLGGLTNGGLATVVLTVHPNTNGPAGLTASATANEPDAFIADNISTGGPFAGIADIDILSGNFSPGVVTPGQPFDTLITITNRGPDSADVRVTVTWTYPDFPVSITTSQGTTMVTIFDNGYYASIGSIPAGSSSVVSIRSVNVSGGTGGIFVSVFGDGVDPDNLDYFTGEPTVQPGPGLFTFDSQEYSVRESDGSAILRVARYGGAVGVATVSYATSPGSAAAGSDYTPASGTLTFADGETEKIISVAVLNDFDVECDEYFTVSLSNPTGGAALYPYGSSNCIVQIREDDPVLRGVVSGVSVTVTNADAAGDNYSEILSISDEGRYVAFTSSARNLVATECNGLFQVFVRDLLAGTTTLASVSRYGTNSAETGASQPQLSRDGKYLAFVSSSPDLTTNSATSGYSQVYLRNLMDGTTRLVSSDFPNDGEMYNPLVTSNGLGVAFHGNARGIGIVDVNSTADVFFHDASAGVTHVVSVNRWGTATGNGQSSLPNPTGFTGYRINGQYIGFTSSASDLVAADNNSANDVFVRDLTNRVTILVSVNRFGTGSGNSDSFDPLVSANGRYVLFHSSASDLVAADENGLGDVFVRDLVAGVTLPVSVNRLGTGTGNGNSFHMGFSTDGRYALFWSEASDLVANDNNGVPDLFVRDLVLGTTILVSKNCDGDNLFNIDTATVSMSPDGRFVAFANPSTGLAYLRDILAGTTTLLSPNRLGGISAQGGCTATAVASGAAAVVFQSTADDLLLIDENSSQDIFAWRAYAPGSADLVVQQIDSPHLAPAGAGVTYAIGVRNHGATNATNIVLVDTLPPGATFSSATPSQGSCSNFNGTVTCHLGTLAVDALATIQITALLSSPGLFTNFAFASATQPDPQTSNNLSAAVTARAGTADLALRMTSTQPRVIPGQSIFFYITVSNLGPNTANGVEVKSTLSGQGYFSDWSIASQGDVQYNGNNPTWKAGSIEPLGAATLLIAATPIAYGPLAHVATVSSVDMDPMPANNSATNTSEAVRNLGEIHFLQDYYVGSEGTGPAVVTVTRDGENDATVSVRYETSPDSATADADYTPVSGILVFTNGETMKTITIPIVDDGVIECLERFHVSLSDPTDGATLGSPSIADVWIGDNEGLPSGYLIGVSVAATNPAALGNDNSYQQSRIAVSDDGRYVAFVSDAQNLVSHQKPLSRHEVYVRDLQSAQTVLVSTGNDPSTEGTSSFDVALSADGRFVAFSGVGQFAPNYAQLIVRDWRTGQNRLASVRPNGLGGNSLSQAPSFSSNGQVVAFSSAASDLAAGDTNLSNDIFVWDSTTGAAQLVSVNRVGSGPGNRGSAQPVISANGRFVAFASSASDLVNNDTNELMDVFVRDLTAGTTTLASANPAGDGSNRDSHDPVLSADGRYVAFVSRSVNPGIEDVFVRDLVMGITRLVSVSPEGTGGMDNSSQPQISADGRYVAFASWAQNLVTVHLPAYYNVYLRDLTSNTTTLVSTRCGSADGADKNSYWPALSSDGRYVAFHSAAGDLTSDALPPGPGNIFRRDMVTGQTILCSRNYSGLGGSDDFFWPPNISGSGNSVLFHTPATNLLPFAMGSINLYAWMSEPFPVPPVPSAAQSGGTVFITWLQPGNNCTLLTSSNPLAPVSTWTPVTSGITEFGLVKVYANHPAPGDRTRYYRLRCP